MLVYIHIPFCDSKCSYCAFNSYVDKFHLKQEYMKALEIQLEFELKRFKYQKIETLFIGGGTPSTVEPSLYKNIFKKLEPYFEKDIEITTEANPNSATYSWLQGMFQLGVNRISFGVQSFNDKKLKLLNRAHNAQQAKKAIQNAHNIGYKNLSIDIIYATLGDTQELLEYDLEEAFKLPINHLSAYALTIESGTPFEKTPQMASEQLELTQNFFNHIKKHGFKQYEISNFGRYKSKHNLGYWHYKDYIGLGSGSVGKLENKRFYPTNHIENYIVNPLDISEEILSKDDVKIEKIFLGLRSEVGISISLFSTEELKRVELLVNEKKLLFKDGVFYNFDYLLADEIALFITA